MPGPYTICTYPGCGTLIDVTTSRCEKHPYPKAKDRRPGASARGYDADWVKLRDEYAAEHPLCELRVRCNGAPMADVDHKVPLEAGGARLDRDNLQSLCRSCHRWKTLNIDPTYTRRPPMADRS